MGGGGESVVKNVEVGPGAMAQWLKHRLEASGSPKQFGGTQLPVQAAPLPRQLSARGLEKQRG